MASASDRQALAAKNGKPRDANRIAGRTAAMDARDYGGRGTANDGSVIERDGDTVYRYVPKYDHTIIERNGMTGSPVRGNQLPSQSMNAYVDKVLEMSGMTGAPQNVPVPQSRPSMDDGVVSGMTGTENNPGKLKDDTVVVDSEEPGTDAGGSEWSMTDLLLGVLGIGGATAAARALLKRYQNGERGTINPDGTASLSTANAADDITAIADSDEQKAISGPDAKQARLPAPPQQIEGPRAALPAPNAQLPAPVAPNAVDESIASTLSEDDIDAIFRDRVEGVAPRPSDQNRFSEGSNIDAVVRDAASLADRGDIRGAVNILRQNGIELDENMLRTLAESSNTAKSLRQRAGDMAGQAARRAVTQ